MTIHISDRLNDGIQKNVEPQKEAVKANNFVSAKLIGTDYTYKHTIVWQNVIGFLILHMLGLWGWYYIISTGSLVNPKAFLYTKIWFLLAAEGITIGAHRYYTHRAFKAKPALRFIFCLFQVVAGQNCMFVWCRDHRLHHRYSDTDADPHNAKRGFFFSHIGWLMTKKHPYVIDLGRKIDLSDLEADWMVMFQKKYFYYIYAVFGMLVPISIGVYYGISLPKAFLTCYCAPYILVLNATWLVNSAAHIFGTRPYDKNLQPVESWFVSLLSMGEGWHNYHHAFPWDYKAAELPTFINLSAVFIRFFEIIGLASDLKSVNPESVKNRVLKTGDGTHFELGNEEAKAAVTAWGPLHPLNPTYTTKFEAPSAEVVQQGLPLFHDKDQLYDNVNRRSDVVFVIRPGGEI